MIHDSNTSAIELNNELAKINRWSFQWKRVLTQIQKKQAQEVDNSRLKKKVFAKIMTGFKQWNIGVVSGKKGGVPSRNYIESIRRTFVFKGLAETT